MNVENLNNQLTLFYQYYVEDETSVEVRNLTKLVDSAVEEIFEFELSIDREHVDRFLIRLFPKTAEDHVGRIIQLIQRLEDHGLRFPRIFHTGISETIFGRPFIIMESMKGMNLYSLLARASPEQQSKLFGIFCRKMLEIHSIGWAQIIEEKPDLSEYFDLRISDIRQGPIRAHPILLPAIEYLRQMHSKIKFLPAVIIHSNYHPGNIMASNNTLIITGFTGLQLSDPREDVANTIFELQRRNSEILANQFKSIYAGQAGFKLRNLAFFKVLISLNGINELLQVKSSPKPTESLSNEIVQQGHFYVNYLEQKFDLKLDDIRLKLSI